MQILQIAPTLEVFVRNPVFIHLALILLAFIITYCRVLGKDFWMVIDDAEGIFKYSDRFIPETITKEGKVNPEEFIDYYDCCEGEKRHKVKNLAYNPHLGFPGSVLRFIRLNIGKRFCVIGTNKKGHEIYGYKQSARRHHVLSMLVQFTNLVLGYFFLTPLIGSNLAFASCLLYSVHPLTTQSVGWISGINYSLSMLFSLAVLDLSLYLTDFHFIIPLTVLFSFLSGIVLYIGCFTWVILWFLGFKWAALASAIIGLFILIWKGNETKSFRVSSFKEQNMDHTTTLNLRKPIVMVKTMWYYIPQVLMPLRMGLYHVWGYFYDDPIERVDAMFFLGVLTLIGVFGLWHFGTLPIHIGIIWYFTFIILFSNFITAQQFVADRYVTVPAFGICLILSCLLHGTIFYWILVGLYAMRTFMHLFTFRNEIDFYLSNFMNFRKSEVSLGNLGVAYMNQGMPGAAVDTWMMATKVNPQYDVSWYNLYSMFRTNGRLEEAKGFLQKCLDSKIVHFDKRWQEEMVSLDSKIKAQSQAPSSPQHLKMFDDAKLCFENKDLLGEHQILTKFLEGSTDGILPEMITSVKGRLAEIERDNIQLRNPLPNK